MDVLEEHGIHSSVLISQQQQHNISTSSTGVKTQKSTELNGTLVNFKFWKCPSHVSREKNVDEENESDVRGSKICLSK